MYRFPWFLHGERRNACRVLLGKPERERLLRKRRHTWKEDIKMDLKEIGVVWTGLVWLRIGTNGRFL
jgi:hypothetical protein